jgi:hypothetical protein
VEQLRRRRGRGRTEVDGDAVALAATDAGAEVVERDRCLSSPATTAASSARVAPASMGRERTAEQRFDVHPTRRVAFPSFASSRPRSTLVRAGRP